MAKSPMAGKGANLQWLKDHVSYRGDECLVWPFCRDRHGYGQVGINGKLHRAHRVMCELVNGPAPEPTMHAAHSCGNGHLGCINPLHLDWKTPSGNQLDRAAHGTKNDAWWSHRQKVTNAQKAEIVSLEGKYPQYVIAKMFDVSPHTVRRIHRSAATTRCS
jgi:hypothetical protein